MILPWAGMLREALAAGITPEAFWRLSLREWRWLSTDGTGPGRTGLEALMARFPDTEDNPHAVE